MPHRQEPTLRVAYIVGAFPTLSQTFVANQMVGVAARGHEVDVYTTHDEAATDVPHELVRYGLMERRYSIAVSRSRAAAVRHTFWLLLTVGWRTPMLVGRLLGEVLCHGFAGSIRLLYAALTLAERGAPHYDVIHAQFGPYGRLAMQLRRVGAISGAIVTSFRGYDVGQYLRGGALAYSRLFREGALFLPVSDALAARLVTAGCDAAKVRVHRSGIPVRRLVYRGSHLDSNRVHFITVARLVEKKGVAYAIQAVAQLRAAGRAVFYTVVGDGPLRADLEALIWHLQLGDSVRLLGARPHAEALRVMQTADILLAPSVTAADGDEEGIPNAVKEAMAMGLPVVATAHGGIPELVEDRVSGFLVPERDVNALASCLAFALDHPQLWPAMGNAARRRIEREYDIEHLNDELITLYRGIAAKSAPARTGHCATPMAPADVATILLADTVRQPVVSVVIPTHNRSQLVARAIRSVQRQTYAKLEIIVVDDASNDDTAAVVQSIADPRIRYVRHERNRGGAAARNTGICAATGDYIAFLDDDDEWEPAKTSTQLQALATCDVVLCTGDKTPGAGRAGHEVVGLDDLRFGRFTAGGTGVLMAKAHVLRQTMFDDTLPRYQDWDLFIRIALKHKVQYLDLPLVRYNDGDHFRITNSVIKMPTAELEQQFRMLRKHKDFFGPRLFRRHMSRALLYGVKHRADRWNHLAYVMRNYGPINAVSAVGLRVKAILQQRVNDMWPVVPMGSKRGAV